MSDPLQVGTLRTIRQEPDSYDCGFFAGFALNLVRSYPHTFLQVEFCRNDVYEAREASFGRIPATTLTKTASGAQSLGNAAAVTHYLRFLGCTGYKGYSRASRRSYVDLRSEPAVQEVLVNNVKQFSAKAGMMVNFGYGHWVSVLGRANSSSAAKYIIYDPAGPPKDLQVGTAATVAKWIVLGKAESVVLKGPLPGEL